MQLKGPDRMPVNKTDVVRIVKSGAQNEAEKNALLAIAGLKPGLWGCLEDEDVLGVLRCYALTVSKSAVAQIIRNGAKDEADKIFLLVIAGLHPGLWAGRKEEDVLGVLRHQSMMAKDSRN